MTRWGTPCFAASATSSSSESPRIGWTFPFLILTSPRWYLGVRPPPPRNTGVFVQSRLPSARFMANSNKRDGGRILAAPARRQNHTPPGFRQPAPPTTQNRHSPKSPAERPRLRLMSIVRYHQPLNKPRLTFHTSHNRTACLSPSSALRVGMNSWPSFPYTHS